MKNVIYTICLMAFLTSCSEKINLFNAKIAATDINGTKKFGPKNSARISKRIKDPLLPKLEYDFLGRLVSSKNLRSNIGFIDFIFLKGDYGVIDEVYIAFLDEAVIPNYVPIESEITSTEWNKFKTDFSSLSTYSARKDLMFKPENLKIRRMLEGSIYTSIPNDIVQNQKIEQIFKSGLESNVKAVLKESNVELTAEVKAQLESMVKTNVSIKGKYVDIELRKEFADKLVALLRNLKNNPPASTTTNPFLANYLENFIGKRDLVANGYSLLQFEITYNTSKINKTEIQAVIDGIATLSQTDKVNLTAKVYSSFSFTRDFNGESKSTKNYLVRYSYNDNFEGQRK